MVKSKKKIAPKPKKDKKITKSEPEEDLLTGASDDFLLRHSAFIEEYLFCFNGTQAWFYSHPDLDPENPKDYNTASACSSRLLRNAKVRSELDKRFSARMMSKREVLDRLRNQAQATLLPFVKVDENGYIFFNFKHPDAKRNFHLIKKVKHKKTETENNLLQTSTTEHWVEVELHDPQKALELIGKYYALFTEKVQQTEKKIIKVTIKREEE